MSAGGSLNESAAGLASLTRSPLDRGVDWTDVVVQRITIRVWRGRILCCLGGDERLHATPSTTCGPLAQLAEQQTLNLRVLGSIPRRLTIFLLKKRYFRGGSASATRVDSLTESQRFRLSKRRPFSLPPRG